MRVSISGTAITGYDDTRVASDTEVDFPGNPANYPDFPHGYTVTGSAGSRVLNQPAFGNNKAQVVAVEITSPTAPSNLTTQGAEGASPSSAVQPIDSDLTAIAALSTTAFGRGLLDDATAAAVRSTLGLGTAAVTDSTAYDRLGAGFPRTKIVLFGNSLPGLDTAPLQNGGLAQWYYNSQGIFGWANQELSQPFVPIVQGHPGWTTSQLAAVVAAEVVAADADWALCFGMFINDITQAAATTVEMEANATAIWDAIRASGKRLVLCVDWPSGSTQLSTAAKLQQTADVRRFTIAYARQHPAVILVDWAPLMTDVTTGYTLAAVSNDLTHQNPLGASKAGHFLAGILRPYVAHLSAGFPWPNSTADTSAFVQNPMATGNTAGVATSFTSGTSGTAGGSGVAPVFTPTKVARTDGIVGEWAQYAVTSGDLTVRLSLKNPLPTGLAIGDTVYGAVEFQTDGTTDSAGNPIWPAGSPRFFIEMLAIDASSGVLLTHRSIWQTVPTLSTVYRAPSGIMLCGPMILPALTTQIQLGLRFHASDTSGSGTFRIGRNAIIKAGSF